MSDRSFEALVAESEPALRRLAWLLTLNRADADELVQDAFLRLWADWERRSDHPNLHAWLRTVVTNLAHDRRRRQHAFARRAPLVAQPPLDHPTEFHLDLHRGLARLSLRQRQCVALRFWAGLSLEECAATLAISEGAVSQHLARAKRRLEAALGTTIIDDGRTT